MSVSRQRLSSVGVGLYVRERYISNVIVVFKNPGWILNAFLNSDRANFLLIKERSVVCHFLSLIFIIAYT